MTMTAASSQKITGSLCCHLVLYSQLSSSLAIHGYQKAAFLRGESLRVIAACIEGLSRVHFRNYNKRQLACTPSFIFIFSCAY